MDETEEAGPERIVLAVDHQCAVAGVDVEDLPEVPPVQHPGFPVEFPFLIVFPEYGDRQIGRQEILCLQKNTFLIHSDTPPILLDWSNCTTGRRIFQLFQNGLY